MNIEATVTEDGTLIAKVPKKLKGKKVRISIRESAPEKPSQWDEIARIVEETGSLDISRRTHEEILRDLREFRESG
jgi:hypothetical protein